MKIVTAADQQYFVALINLVGSLHYWAPEQALLVYDLGLTSEQIDETSHWRNVELVREFGLESAPEHCRALLTYAWKPLVLAHAIERQEQILWIDAGSDFRAPLQPIQSQLQQDGYLFVQGQDLDMTLKSHPQCYREMHTDISRFSGKPYFAGNLQGYTRPSPACTRILEPMLRYALNRDCIAPIGSTLDNHRFDQTVLSILAYQSGLTIRPATRRLAAERHQLEEIPLRPSSRIVYTARGSSIEYLRQLQDHQSRIRFPNAPQADA